MKYLISNIKLSKLLLSSANILKEIHGSIKQDFSNFKFRDELIFGFSNKGYSEIFKRNFFTLLMLSVLLESKLSKDKVISYGKIIFLLRQIVTSTDNIIDVEDKGDIKFKNLTNIIVKNNFLSLMCQDLLTKECLKVSNGNLELSNKILEELYSIAFSENLRDSHLYTSYPDSKFILNKIHSGIGGKLLEISLVAPNYIENNSQINNFSSGLYEIGMSLQAIDDLFDIQEDIDANKINLALGKFLEENIDISEADFHSLDDTFSKKFLEKIVESAYHGFFILSNNGFPISHSDAKQMLKKLFKLRGLEQYVEIIK
ncbi:MAG: hypothetical protein KA493_00820 [Fusobacteriaceae bacterium]|nr:hypothetical protein [Fusobacteriaceae bacterium]